MAEADEVACKVEHVLGEKVLSRLVCLTEAISKRDDCRPLRLFLEKVMPQLHSDEDDEDELIPLPQLPAGKRAIVGRIDESLKSRKKFADLGLVDGTFLQMEGPSPNGEFLKIKVLYSSLAIRAQEAEFIMVKPTEE